MEELHRVNRNRGHPAAGAFEREGRTCQVHLREGPPPKMSPLGLAARGMAMVRRWAPPGGFGSAFMASINAAAL
jgi:hypothetical protein